MIRRREFIAGLGSAAAWPVLARAQQPERMRRIGVFANFTVDDPRSAWLMAFLQELQRLGWSEGRNIRFDIRWAGSDIEPYRAVAAELLALEPDVILALGNSVAGTLLQGTRAVPIVFVGPIDPVGGGLVASLARPGGNATGFAAPEYAFSAKWLELLKEIAPRVTRVAVLRNTSLAGAGQFGAIQNAAPSFGVELRPFDARDISEVERALPAFAREPNSGLIVTASASAFSHRATIVALAARYRLPAVYPNRAYATAGGLISYQFDQVNSFRRAAGYVDRILKGEKPADLPVQAPTKFETVINVKTAKALGLAVPQSILLRADEVIE
jgi:putative ABC transport system substrate-binding protein